ncbi:cobalamin-binding protein [Chloroflexota bacterium]
MKKASRLLLLLLLSISVLIVPATGCINNELETVTLTETYIKTVTTTSIITTTVEKVTIIDDLGREVAIEGTPSRIVSLAPSNTEILFALGLGDKVFGVTEYCNYPEEASAKEKVGGYSGVDMEKVVAINPDLILAEDLHKLEVIPALEQLGFTVIALVPHNLQEVMDSITLIGTITGAEATASQIVDDISQRIKAITDVTDGLTEEDKVKVLYVIWHEPIMSVGTDTRIHELIEKTGGINIAEVAGEGYPTLALEEIVSINPQVIIVNDDISLQSILNETRLSEIDAIVNGMVYGINADLTNRPTARIVEGLELMAKMIHPELFGSIE